MIQGRKIDHLKICAEKDVEFRDKTTLLEDVQLVHAALAGVSLDAIDTRAKFMGKTLKAPVLISAISGGVGMADKLNRDLARAAQKLGIGFCFGSQRPMLEDPKRAAAYDVRDLAPDIPILGNIGIQQAAETDPAAVQALASSVRADGIALHLNPAQELSQTEGDRRFPDGGRTLRALTRRMPGRIMVKETGCGISRAVAIKLKRAGVRVVDVSGAGGTSWTRVESLRKGLDPKKRSWMDEWGIPTAASLRQVSGLGLKVVGSGGVRTGLDVAKCLALGADVASMALPVLRAYTKGGYTGVLSYFETVIADLKAVMLLVGAKDVSSLKRHKPVITGRLKEWANSGR